MFTIAKGKKQCYSVRNRLLIISHITFRDCRVRIFFSTTFLEIAVYIKNSVMADPLRLLAGKLPSP